MNLIQKIALVFTIIGGINWGLIGMFDFNLVDFIFQSNSIITRIIYSLVGICALFNIIIFFLHLDRRVE